MSHATRRKFLAEVGQGMVVATIGYGAALELGLTPALAADAPPRLAFGTREALVALMQDTPADKLLPILIKQLGEGTPLRELVAAAALANARTFGGEDYIGFHSFMALAPAWNMARQLPADRAALPVFKVIYRNTSRMQDKGGSSDEVLHPIVADSTEATSRGEQIRAAVREKNLNQAEQLLVARAQHSPEDALNDLLPAVADGVEVHRTVLAYRAWDLLDLVGREHASTFLRQSLHYCVDNCKPNYSDRFLAIRAQLPKLIDQYKLEQHSPGTRVADDSWIEVMSETLLKSTAEQAADAVAAALAEGFSNDSVAEAISLAGNQLVLRDPGRPAKYAQPNKPEGSVHGDSIGVHACDSINAWRNIARVANRRNSVTSLILAGWQAASDGGLNNGVASSPPRPEPEQLEKIRTRDPAALLSELDDAIRHNDQARACAAAHLYGEQDLPPKALSDLLLGYAISEDGALHAEKFYNTTTEEFARTRPKFRWRQLVALARVTASEYGQPAPGMEQARRLLGV